LTAKRCRHQPKPGASLQLITLLLLLLNSFLPSASGMTAEGSSSLSYLPDVRESGKLILQDEFDRLEQFEITAPQLRIPTRTVQVYLPPDYYTSDKRYPVIYLHDGGLLFNPASRDCLYDETLDRLFAEGETEGIIAVGIFSSQNRWDEYSPWVNDNMYDWIVPAKAGSTEGGEGDAYLDFIIDTLKPEIDSRYRTKPGRNNTAIGGFSMGGLISLYAGLERPDVFSRVMAVSPAIWFAESGEYWLQDNQFINYVNSLDVPQNVAFYIDIGTDEWSGVPINAVDQQGKWLGYPFVWVDGADATFNALSAAGVPEQNLILVEDPGGIHDPLSWSERFDDAIMWLWDEREVLPDPGLITVIPPTLAVADPTLLPTESTPLVIEPAESTATPAPEPVIEDEPIPSVTQVVQPEPASEPAAGEIVIYVVMALLVIGIVAVLWLIWRLLRTK